MASEQALSKGTILRVVNTYIGVDSGYLIGFSRRELEEFYPSYCEVELAPTDYSEGTVRERFIATIEAQPPRVQAKILRGLLLKVPSPTARVPNLMTPAEILQVAERLEGLPVSAPHLANTREVVDHALSDAQALLDTRGPTSAVDRVHTALHGHLKALCDGTGITYQDDASAARLLKLLRDQHPALQSLSPQARNALKILLAMGTAVDSVGTIRNNESVAHANDTLAEAPEAMLAINATRTILAYLDTRLGREHGTPVKSSV